MARNGEIKTTKPDAASCSACPYGPPAWQYRCGECGHEFQMPVPKGPSDEKNRACPECNSKNIERVNIVKSEACPPGG